MKNEDELLILQNIIWNGNVPQVHPRTVDASGQALPTAPSDGNSH